MIQRIAHVAFTVKDMEKSVAFYCGVLRLQESFGLTDDAGNPWIKYIKIADGQFIELFYHLKGATSSGSYSHLCLEVDDIQSIAHHRQGRQRPMLDA